MTAHFLIFNNGDNNTLFTGSDGGIHKSDVTAASPVWTSLNNDYVTYQYYHVSISPDAYKDYYIGGCQDNGTVRSLGSSVQTEIFSGDGCGVGLGHKSGVYTEFVSTQNGNVSRREKTISPFFTSAQLIPNSLMTVNKSLFVTYFHLDPDNPDLLYYPNGNDLYRQTAATTANQNTGWTLMTGANTQIGSSKVRTMATTRGPYDNTKASLFIGTEGGEVIRLDDPKNAAAGAAAVDITPTGMSGGGLVSDISVNPRNDDTILVVYSNYNVNSIWWTGNANTASPTWINLTGGSPEFVPSARSCEIIINDNVVEYYVGSSAGLFSNTSATASSSWTREGSSSVGFSVVASMDARPSDNRLLLGTHGNGLFVADIGNPIKKEIASALGNSVRQLGPNERVMFTNSDDEIIAEVENLSSHDYGLTTVSIDNAGTGTMNFSTNTAAAQKIMNKTILISPSSNNTSGNVRIKTYFTNAEVTNWETATSQLRTDLNQIKSTGVIASATVANSVYGSNITVNSNYLVNNVELSATYTNGFSGLAGGLDGASGPLPVDLIHFSGLRQDESIVLSWHTAIELNADRFEVERLNKETFELLGSVDAKGNSQNIAEYSFVDDNLENRNSQVFYRLKMIDFDGQYKFSEVLTIQGDDMPFSVSVYPSPASEFITISLGNSIDNIVDIQLFNLEGTLMKTLKNISSYQKLEVADLQEGAYFLVLTSNNQVMETRKILIAR